MQLIAPACGFSEAISCRPLCTQI